MNATIVRRAVLIALLLSAPALAADPAPEKAKQLPWLTDFATAQREALAQQRPIFVRFGGEACPWCKRLETEIEKPAVQSELARWTLVVLDVEVASADARRLAVGPIPALRLLTPAGKVVEASDGYQDAEALIGWLQKHFDACNVAPDAALLAEGEPSVADVLRIVRQFDDRDALVREAAIRRLLAYPAVAREPVIKAFCEGHLSARLTALELLQAWRAPLDRLDPWRPNSFTPERVAALDSWLASPLPDDLQAATKLTEADAKLVAEEVKQMLDAAPADVGAIRERIARRGAAVRPLVFQQLQEASTDEARERLLALRYRLVSGGDLPLRWPGGLERLASTDARERHRAAEELAKMAAAEQQPLLLELFSDSDPLVRETSLRGLRNLGGKKATAALVRLLDDPDPNVRAAVLKQLAEDAPVDMLDKIGKYVQQEKDADLIVHAIRYFREVKGGDTSAYLLPLLKHDAWQVRAEAAEAAAKLIDGHQFSGRPSQGGGAIVTSLLPLLEDPDAYVVSRAVLGLKGHADAASVPALVKVAEQHPTLTVEVVRLLTSNALMKKRALPHLKTYLKHDNPSVRAAVLTGLVEAGSTDSAEYLTAALSDPESAVRIAAAQAIVALLQKARPDPDELRQGRAAAHSIELETASEDSLIGGAFKRIFGNATAKPRPTEKPPEKDAAARLEIEEPLTPAQVAWDRWLEELYAGKHRSAWMQPLVEPLQTMLAAKSSAEQVAAALALIPLGQAERAVPVLIENAGASDDAFHQAVRAFDWLRWPQRAQLFRALTKNALDADQLQSVYYNVDTPPDVRFVPELWASLELPTAAPEIASSAQRALLTSYFGQSYYDTSQASAAQLKRVVDDAQPRAGRGSVTQRLIAINFLLKFAREHAKASAEALSADENAPAALRGDAFQLLLVALPAVEREQQAIDALASGNSDRATVALRYLALGSSALGHLPASDFEVEVLSEANESRDLTPSNVPAFKPIVPLAPHALKVEHVKSLTASEQPATAAYAGYLLALLGDPAGIEPLLKHWRATPVDSALDRLVYRAIAVVDDPQHIGVLRQIYARLDDSDKTEFYWTIRIMSGADVLELRKQIRKDVGIDQLRGQGGLF
jgi:HEAT repeat protein